MQKSALIVLMFVSFVIVGNWYINAYGVEQSVDTKNTLNRVNTYSECVAAGNPIMESYPEHCRSTDSRTFVNTATAVNEDDFPMSNTNVYSTEKAALAAVRVFASKDLDVTKDQIGIMSITPQEWSDGCLGLGSAEEMCIMIITPGYEVILKAEGTMAVYRSDQTGLIVKNEQTL